MIKSNKQIKYTIKKPYNQIEYTIKKLNNQIEYTINQKAQQSRILNSWIEKHSNKQDKQQKMIQINATIWIRNIFKTASINSVQVLFLKLIQICLQQFNFIKQNNTSMDNKFHQFKNNKEIQDYAAENNKILLVYDDYVLDATTFAHHHPGGAGLILNYQSKDITQQMKGHHPLSLRMADSIIIGSFKKEISKYIDPSKPLMDQVWDMDHDTYLKIVESPHWLFVPSPRMFESDLNEWFSHNKWQRIFILPTILSAYWLYTTDLTTATPLQLFLTLLLGVFIFSLLEYMLHRFVFHSEKWLPNNRVVRYLHYTLHGIHHMLPNDPDRLVYPPILFTITYFLLETLVFQPLQPQNQAIGVFFKIGVLLGYLTYDCTHYALHHVDTRKHKGSYFHRLQKYHNQHHFGGEEAGFGVSSKFWDIIFGTGFKKPDVHDHFGTKTA